MKRKNYLLKTMWVFMAMTCNTLLIAQNPSISIEELSEKYNPLQKELRTCFDNKQFEQGIKVVNEMVQVFDRLPEAGRQQFKQVQATNYYNLACFYSLQNKKKQAIAAFEKCVTEYGYLNYAHAKADTDLDNIRNDKRFKELMAGIQEKSDYKYILQQAGGYVKTDTTGLPHFFYEPATNARLQDVKNYFKLDSVAGPSDEISKIINLMTWVHDNIRHDGSNYALCEFDAIDFYHYYKATGKGINCRGMAITLNECYLAMGFPSRFVICMPKDENDPDCHVINCVYSSTLKKWIWMDPSFNAYVKDENGNLLSIEEVRERLINDKPLVLNPDANHNQTEKQTKENYLDSYMAKNLYWIQCPLISKFNPESRYRNNTERYVSLLPSGFQNTDKKIATSDPAYFWQEP
ncbi:transglutaminase [Bacteroidia bacterium]|nr:transglutaminase [Bacteroidia bacterium]